MLRDRSCSRGKAQQVLGRNVSQDPSKPGLELGPAKAAAGPSCPRVTVGEQSTVTGENPAGIH